ncbi:hypothetical protein OH799_25490 [Nocardia sp. NBC_00881]|uniref:hypothetical protein n=1 Tax=Nocardia sp. NBC_00881 TaxID=2975995 RepID=UPI00386CD90B|nr:hypothetical protein OH799_25490 [Nocardia sp. NBC_00881]
MPVAFLTAFTVAAVFYATICFFDRPVRSPETCHLAPDFPYTPEDAHLVWQARIGCDTETCADKAAALDVLIEAKLVKPWRAAR